MTGMEWIAVMVRGADEQVERFATMKEAIDRIVDDWTHLTAAERRSARDYVGRITEDYDETGDIQEIVMDTDETIDIHFTHGDRAYYIEAPDLHGEWEDDVWRCIGMYDDLNGTDFYDHLGTDDVLGVNLDHDSAEKVESWDDVEDQRIEEVSATVQVKRSGHSLIIKITDPARMLGVSYGDYVDITIRRH